MLTFIVSAMIVRETCIQKTKTFQCHIYGKIYIRIQTIYIRIFTNILM